MQFEVHHCNKIITTDLRNLSRNLKNNSEIYLLKEGEVSYLGLLSDRSVIYLANKLANYALQNYSKSDSSKAKVCASIMIKLIEDLASVSSQEQTCDWLICTSCAAANAIDFVAANATHCVTSADTTVKSAEEEYERQGRFILEFLQSDKALFLL